MTSRTFHVAAMTSLALVLTSPSTATAANEIEVRAYDANRSEILIFGVFPKTYAAGAPIEITSITDCTRYLTIRSLVQPVASVGRIRLQRNGEPGCVPGDVTVFFGQGPYQGDSFPPPATAAIADCAGIDDFGDTNSPPFRNQIKVAGRIGSNITGNMNVGGVRVFRVDGNIQSAIDVQPSIFWQSGQFTDFRVVGDILASGSIVSRFGDIQSMVVLGSVFGPVSCVQGAIRSLQITGDLAAQVKAGVAGGSAGLIESLSIGGAALRGQQSEPDIFAPVGTIKSVQVAGDIGTPSSLVRIEWRGSPSDGACELISGDSLHLSLNATDQNSEINRVFAGFDITGSLAFGKLRRVNAQSGLVISRDCTANIHIRGDVDAPMTIANLLATNSTITIGGKLLCPGGNCATPAVTLPIASGLRGQLVINAINDGREWFGNVRVGSLTLSQSAPYYTYPQSSTLFGGGAVGRVPRIERVRKASGNLDSSA